MPARSSDPDFAHPFYSGFTEVELISTILAAICATSSQERAELKVASNRPWALFAAQCRHWLDPGGLMGGNAGCDQRRETEKDGYAGKRQGVRGLHTV